jgi:peptidoglycan/xylan/chitin deacetylase (PgdA/CDA1 family)
MRGAYAQPDAKTAEQYAAREAIPRMLEMFERRRIKVTAMVCGLSCEHHPELVKQIAQGGHECASHGRSHDFQYQLPRDLSGPSSRNRPI